MGVAEALIPTRIPDQAEADRIAVIARLSITPGSPVKVGSGGGTGLGIDMLEACAKPGRNGTI